MTPHKRETFLFSTLTGSLNKNLFFTSRIRIIPNNHVLVEQELTVFIVVVYFLAEHFLHELPHQLPIHVFLAAPECVQHVQRNIELATEVVTQGQTHPGGFLGRLQLTDCLPGLLEALQISHVNLQYREVSPALQILFVELESIFETLDRLIVLSLRSDGEGVCPPGSRRLDVQLDGRPHCLQGLLSPPQPSQTEGLVGESLHVFTSFAVGKDLFGKSEPALELFLLVTFVEPFQHPRLLISHLAIGRHGQLEAGVSICLTPSSAALTAPSLRLNICWL